MRYFRNVKAAAKRIGGLFRIVLSAGIIVLCVATLPVAAASAQGLTGSGSGEVQVSLCSNAGSPDMSVLEPRDGTLFTANPVVVKVSVVDLGQARLYVDNALLSTIALGESATDFDASLVLPSGNHIIKVVGYDLCDHVFATVSLSMTMRLPTEKAAAPTTPVQTPLRLPQPTVPVLAGDVIVYHDTKQADDTKGPESSGSVGSGSEGSGGSGNDAAPGQPLLDTLMEWLNPGPTFAGAANVARALAGLAGAVLVLNAHFATGVARELLQVYLSRQKGTKLQKKKFLRQNLGRFRLAAQGAGVILLLGMFVI